MNGIILNEKWVKLCPKCNKEVHYKNKKCLSNSLRKNQPCKSCGLSDRKMPPLTEEHKNKIKDHHKKYGVGLWMIGRKLSDFTRNKLSKIHKGKILSQETKDKIAIGKLGSKNPMKRLDVRIKKSQSSRKNHHIVSNETRKKLSIKARINVVRQLEKMGISPRPFFNPVACKYLDSLNRKYQWNLRHALNGGEYYIRDLGYWLDGYDKDKNIVVEYDEPHHYSLEKLKEGDISRMIEIMETLKCRFIRYDESKNKLYEVFNNNGEITDDDLKI